MSWMQTITAVHPGDHGRTQSRFQLADQKGLKPGERVVYEGLQKVKDGAAVKPTLQTQTETDKQKKVIKHG
jgi:hypothetical protein